MFTVDVKQQCNNNKIKTWYVSLGIHVILRLQNDGPGLPMTFFTARSNLVPYACVWLNGKNSRFFRTYCSIYQN